MLPTKHGSKVLILEACKDTSEILSIAARYYLLHPEKLTPGTKTLMITMREDNQRLIRENSQ